MKVIIAGSRTISGFHLVAHCVGDSGFDITEVVCGCAKGIDTSGKEWAEFAMIPVKEFPADWDRYGDAAGFVRNLQMAEYADALILIWDGRSRGSRNMLSVARERGLKIKEFKA